MDGFVDDLVPGIRIDGLGQAGPDQFFSRHIIKKGLELIQGFGFGVRGIVGLLHPLAVNIVVA